MSPKTPQKTKIQNKPELRFPEFSNSWEERKLGKISTLITKGTTPTSVGFKFRKEGINFVKVENIDNSSNINILNTPKISKECNEALGRSRLKENDILFSIAGTLGRTAIVKQKDLPANTNQALSIIRLKNNYSINFINVYLNLWEIKRYIYRMLSVGAQPNLSLQQVGDIILNIPSLPEQQKIANFLSKIDEWIENLQSQKKDLEKYKKGMMQEIFSQEIRFKDDNGKNFPKWEKKKISEIFEITRGYVLAVKNMKESESNEYKYPVYSSQTKNKGLVGYYNDYLYEDAITWTTDGANAGDVNFRKGKFYCTNVCGVLINKSGFANNLVAELLNSVSKKYVSYVGNPKLMNNVMSQIKIDIPCVREQQKIADFLTNLDNLINLKDKQIFQARDWKKGLIQMMFV